VGPAIGGLKEWGARWRGELSGSMAKRAVTRHSRERHAAIGPCCMTGSRNIATHSGSAARALALLRSRDWSSRRTVFFAGGISLRADPAVLHKGSAHLAGSSAALPRGGGPQTSARRGPNAAQPKHRPSANSTYGLNLSIASGGWPGRRRERSRPDRSYLPATSRRTWQFHCDKRHSDGSRMRPSFVDRRKKWTVGARKICRSIGTLTRRDMDLLKFR